MHSANFWIASNIVPHISVWHPLGYHRRGQRIAQNPKERNDIWMGDPPPDCDLPTEVLMVIVSQSYQRDIKNSWKFTSLTCCESSLSRTRRALIATRLPLEMPSQTSLKSPEATGSSVILVIPSVIMCEAGSTPARPQSSRNISNILMSFCGAVSACAG